ncbi:MAG: dTDP-4-dehydrorhamnose reductase [Odoribacter sp.]|nr:dTDP-4-dehydrorhamnose reductase [Odoribacter sp.]
MTNVLVMGAKGQLGQALYKNGFTALDEVFYTDAEELDITDSKAIEAFIKENEIDTIVNCAAYTAVDKAEEEPEKAYLLNRDGVANLAWAAAKTDCLLIHISTDYVFDGLAKEPYTEKSRTNPKTVYGKSKLEGEKAVINSNCLYVIIRTSWLYSIYGNNFVKSIRKKAEELGELNVVNDQLGTPTLADDLAQAIVDIIADPDVVDKEGIYHYSDEGVCLWYDFAVEIVKQSRISCIVNPVTSDKYPVKAIRPPYSVLDKTKIKKTFDITIPDWKESLAKCIVELENNAF